jgi:hypothetical protein
MTDKPKRQRKKPEKKRMGEQQLTTLGEIFPGFADWYKHSYDEEGNLRPEARIPGLTPPEKNEE